MASRFTVLPYSDGVGILLIDARGHVLVERDRASEPAATWHTPEGAIVAGETERDAALRIIAACPGSGDVRVVAQAPGWFTCELPFDELGVSLGGRYCGQRLKWFAMRAGHEAHAGQANVRDPQEWRWVRASALPSLAPTFKRRLYEDVVATFVPLLVPEEVSLVMGSRPASVRKSV